MGIKGLHNEVERYMREAGSAFITELATGLNIEWNEAKLQMARLVTRGLVVKKGKSGRWYWKNSANHGGLRNGAE